MYRSAPSSTIPLPADLASTACERRARVVIPWSSHQSVPLRVVGLVGRPYSALDRPNRQPTERICAATRPADMCRAHTCTSKVRRGLHSAHMLDRTEVPMGDHHTRHCTSCTAALAADNSAELCGSCAVAAQAAPDVAPVLSADFWEQPEIRSVLLSQNSVASSARTGRFNSHRSSRPSSRTGSASLRASSAGSSDLPHPSETSTNWTPGRACCMSRQINCGSGRHPLCPTQAKRRPTELPWRSHSTTKGATCADETC